MTVPVTPHRLAAVQLDWWMELTPRQTTRRQTQPTLNCRVVTLFLPVRIDCIHLRELAVERVERQDAAGHTHVISITSKRRAHDKPDGCAEEGIAPETHEWFAHGDGFQPHNEPECGAEMRGKAERPPQLICFEYDERVGFGLWGGWLVHDTCTCTSHLATPSHAYRDYMVRNPCKYGDGWAFGARRAPEISDTADLV